MIKGTVAFLECLSVQLETFATKESCVKHCHQIESDKENHSYDELHCIVDPLLNAQTGYQHEFEVVQQRISDERVEEQPGLDFLQETGELWILVAVSE